MRYTDGILSDGLRWPLKATLDFSFNLLPNFPDLKGPVLSALRRSPYDWAAFILDPTVDAQVIKIKQDFGPKSIWPLLRLARAFVWTMHRHRLVIQNEELKNNL